MIERTLIGLRRVEVPVGLEDRVSRRMQAEEEAAGWVGHWARLAGRWVWAGAAVACAGVLLLALSSVQGRRAYRAGQEIAVRSGNRSGNRLAGTSLSPAPVAASRAGVAPIVRISEGADAGRPAASARVRSERVSSRHVSLRRARSLPAPEPPLTEEEKLLQRVARSGNQQEMALLNREVQAKEEASARAQFRAFAEREY